VVATRNTMPPTAAIRKRIAAITGAW